MQLYPTRATFHVALAGAAVVAIGAATRVPAVVGFGGAMLIAVALGRAFAVLAVTRLRSAGFEMVWGTAARVARTARDGSTKLTAELRNRGTEEVRAVSIRAVSSSKITVRAEPQEITLPPGGRATIDLEITTPHVGRWGLHGIALEVRGTPAGGEGLYEVPLLFANPFGIEVMPRVMHALLTTARGGRSRRMAEMGRSAALAGEGDELRELREHVPGDPFKRIAWKASAKRGQLLVREMEREERDIVWIVVDASVELWAGSPAPLDDGLDEMGSIAARHLARGDHVGLVVCASRLRTWLPPDSGPIHSAKIASSFCSMASMVDQDRSDLDELEVADRVAEHLRPLDPLALAGVKRGDLDSLANRADALKARAPFAPRLPFARTPREQSLRQYLAAFGIETPPRVEGERARTEEALATVLSRLSTDRPRPSLVHVWSPPPLAASPLVPAIRTLRHRRIAIRWTSPILEKSLALVSGAAAAGVAGSPKKPVEHAIAEAVAIRARVARERGERLLAQLGVRNIFPKIHAERPLPRAEREPHGPPHEPTGEHAA